MSIQGQTGDQTWLKASHLRERVSSAREGRGNCVAELFMNLHPYCYGELRTKSHSPSCSIAVVCSPQLLGLYIASCWRVLPPSCSALELKHLQRFRSSPVEGVTPLLYSPIGLALKLSQRAPEGFPKVVGSGAQFCCLGNDFRGVFRGPFRQL